MTAYDPFPAFRPGANLTALTATARPQALTWKSGADTPARAANVSAPKGFFSMKHAKPILITAAIALAVVWVAFNVSFVKNLIMPATTPTA